MIIRIAVGIVWLLFPVNLFSQTGIIVNVASNHTYDDYMIHVTAGIPVADFYMEQNETFHIGAFAFFNSDSETALPCIVRGSVHTNDSLLDEGQVFLIDSITQNVVAATAVHSGEFIHTQVNPGTYYLQAEPLGYDANYYLSTYYISKANIDEATTITIDYTHSEMGSIDIHLIPSGNGKRTTEAALPVHFYPNPFTGELFIQLEGRDHATIWYAISDIRGTTLKKNELVLTEGINEYSLDVSGLECGVYFVRVISLDNKQVVKMLVKR